MTPTGLMMGVTLVPKRPRVRGGHLRTVGRRHGLEVIRLFPVPAQVFSLGSQLLYFAGWLFGSWMFGEAFSGAACLLFVLLEYLAHPVGIFSRVRHGVRLAGGFLHINLKHGVFWIQRGKRNLGLF